MSLGVIVETTTLGRPGHERGLGRYARACLAAARELGHVVHEFRLGHRAGRFAELADIGDRSVRLVFERADLLHCTYPGGWAATRRKTVTSILDVIPLDLKAHRRTGIKSQLVLRLAAHSDAILTLSEFSASRIVERLGVDRRRIVVAPLPPSPIFFHPPDASPPPALKAPFVLCLVDMATPDPRKRGVWIKPLAEQLGRLGLNLAVLGAGTQHASADLGQAIGLGRLSDRDWAALLPHATCFLYFSAMEGQGLPPLEAMAAGVPVVAADNSAVSEVVADAGILVSERASSWEQRLVDDDRARQMRLDLVDACAAIATDSRLRERLQISSQARAAEFSEQRFRAGLQIAYEMATCG